MTEWSGYGYVEATRKAQDRNYWRQLITSDPAMDGEHDRVVRVSLCGGNKEDTRQELLAATHYIRPSNGWNLTTANLLYITSWLPGFARDPPSLLPSLPRITRLRPEHLQFHRSK